MSALLETLRYDGAQSTTLAASQDTFDSEGKFGIPRFSGEPAQLPEGGGIPWPGAQGWRHGE